MMQQDAKTRADALQHRSNEGERVSREKDITRCEELVLARLLAGGATGLTPSQIAKDLGPLVQHRYIGAEWNAVLNEVLERLERSGHLEANKGRKRFSATPAGQERALRFLGVEKLPPKTTWSALQNVYLLAKALAVPLASNDAVKKLSSATGARAAILQAAHELPTTKIPTQTQAVDALLWKQLGRETNEPFSATAVKTYLLGQVLGTPSKMTVAQLVSAVTAKAVGARRTDRASLNQAVLRRLLGDEPTDADALVAEAPSSEAPVVAPPRPVNLEQFARDVVEAGRSSRTGWFGDPAIANKVFISHVYRAYAERHPDAVPSLEAFKERLIEANRAGLLRLSRADLVQAMNVTDVRDSETRYLNAVYHFVAVRD
jgi:hypothetical protein